MGATWDGMLRDELLDRRKRLVSALHSAHGAERLTSLLREVDDALERVEDGTFGICEHCRGGIEPDRLAANPLVCRCLECLTEEERRALEDDLDLASRIQGGLLPKNTLFDGWDVSFHYQPAGVVSGDYCDVLAADGGRLMFMLGDVSGKGVAASLLMSQLHAIFRTLSPFSAAVNDLVARANRLFCDSTLATHYATLVCGCATPGGEVTICNAGHCPPIVLSERGVEAVEPTGLPLGLFCNAEYDCRVVSLGAGDALALYTDGISEAEDGEQRQYGADRLAGVLAAKRSIAACLADVAAFRGGMPQKDDVTLMLIRRN
jgi:sigma-B regulation protein RsbU (phosphoserine phosphatase)